MTERRLVVTFPRRLARLGVLFFGLLLGLFAGWVKSAEELPWLAVVAGTGCFLGLLLSLGQLLRPKLLAEADSGSLILYRRRFEGGRVEVPWHQVKELSYDEREVDRFLYKLIRLRLDHSLDDAYRLIPDDADVAHLDAFAAEPGGLELFARLEELCSQATGSLSEPLDDSRK